LKYEVLTAVKMSVVVFWVVMLCGLVGGNQRFEGTYRLHLQGLEGLQGLERTIRRWEDNIKIDHRETGYEMGGGWNWLGIVSFGGCCSYWC
jgi:hypothetical protein